MYSNRVTLYGIPTALWSSGALAPLCTYKYAYQLMNRMQSVIVLVVLNPQGLTEISKTSETL